MSVCHKSHYFRIQWIWSFLMFLDTFRIQKCLETEKQPNPLKKSLFSRDYVVSPVLRHIWKRFEGWRVIRLEG